MQGKPLVYLDTAATAQKPQVVIDKLREYYLHDNANVHRGVYQLSERATHEFEQVRDKIKNFANALAREEIIFTKGTTEAINLVAHSFLRPQLKPGDEILLTTMEHHANIVPWQLIAEQTGAVIRVLPMNEDGDLQLDQLEALLTERTKMFSFTYVSNAIGTINPAKQLIAAAHAKNIPVFLDCAQAAPHLRFDVQDLDCDFCAFSSHKCYGPTGVGVLYGKRALLEAMPPYQGGGDMIRTVSFEKTTFNTLPYKFEAGTPNIADVIAFGTAIDYLSALDWEACAKFEHELLLTAKARLAAIPGVRLIGTPKHQASIISFVMDKVHPHDIGTILDHHGVAIRASHHCAMPLMNFFQVPATARASFAFYNTFDEISILGDAVEAAKKIFS